MIINRSLMATILLVIAGCGSKDHYELAPPGGEPLSYVEYRLQNADRLRLLGDHEQIRLQSGFIRLYPEKGTYLKKFTGTEVSESKPDPVTWTKEEEGAFIFSPDSAFLLLSKDPDTSYHHPGYWEGGTFHPPVLDQYDSLWYANESYSIGISGCFSYSLSAK